MPTKSVLKRIKDTHKNLVNAGESYGVSAAQYWADKAFSTGNWAYHIPGALAALWTPCTSDYTFAILTIAYSGGTARTWIPNLRDWIKNPFFYEIGQKTVPMHIYRLVRHLPAIERGKAIVREMGWVRTLFDLRGSWGKTLSEGPTPGGAIFVGGLGAGALATGGDCECQK